MKTISFIITNYNTKKYTEWCYNSIRKNLGNVHEIVMLDDGSEDGTWELLQELKSKDNNMIIHRNEQNVGIAYSYNKMVELSSNEIVCMLHSDMYVPPKFDKVMLDYMEEFDFITPLRVEPNVGYPESVDKLLIDFGTKSEEFSENEFIEWHEKNMEKNAGRVEQRMFFPWMTTKTLYNNIGGNDELFLKYMVDDDDFYLRIKMATEKYCQVFETAVYHMPSKSVRMREDGAIDIDSQYTKSIRNFIRKWGVHPSSVWDENRDMILPKKYNIGFVVRNCTQDMLRFLEPWCNTIYISDAKLVLNYSLEEGKKTLYDMAKRVRKVNFDEEGNVVSGKVDNNIIVTFDSTEMNEPRAAFLQRLSEIIGDSGQPGEMEYDIFKLKINHLGWQSYEKR
tara:strand:- start:3526 stop:4707 length:1182 start_codon:yes stop_codon:yes gene_type:complete